MQLIVSSFGDDGNGTVEREEVFIDMDVTAFVDLVNAQNKRLFISCRRLLTSAKMSLAPIVRLPQ